MPPLLICVVQLCLDFNFIFSAVFKDSLKVLSQHYRHKLTKVAVCINGVNCIHVQDRQCSFCKVYLVFILIVGASEQRKNERQHRFFPCCFFSLF